METHDQKFRGVFLSEAMFDLWFNGKVNSIELLLWALIDSYCSKDEPCRASNGYLAQRIGRKPNHVGDLISHLCRIGLLERLLIQTTWGTQRYLRSIEPAPDFSGPPSRLIRSVSSSSPYGEDSDRKVSTNTFRAVQKDEDSNMPFFEQYQETRPDEVFMSLANRLYASLKAAGRITSPVSKKRWAIEFRRLFKSLDNNYNVIHDVLSWFEKHTKDKFTPRIYSAASFREKFMALQYAMGRHQEDNQAVVDVSDVAMRIVERLKMMHWPKGADQQLPQVVQQSLNALNKWRNDVLGWTSLIENDNDRRKSLAEHLLAAMPGTVHFVEMWFREIHDQIVDWKEWNGKLSVLDVHSKKFNQYGRELTASYCHESERWDRLMKEVYEN